jgi:hypothetical protein
MIKKIFWAILPLVLGACLLIFRDSADGLRGILYYYGLYSLPITWLIYMICFKIVNKNSFIASFSFVIAIGLLITNILVIYSASQSKPEYSSKNKFFREYAKQSDTWLSEMTLPKPPTVYKELMNQLFYGKSNERQNEPFFCDPKSFDKALFQETIQSFKIFPLKQGYVISNKVTALTIKKTGHFVALFDAKDNLLNLFSSACRDESLFDPMRVEDWDNDGLLDLIAKEQNANDTTESRFFTVIYDLDMSVNEKFSLEDSTIHKGIENIPYMTRHTHRVASFENSNLIKIETTEWKSIDEVLKKELIKNHKTTDNMLKTELIYAKNNQLAPTKKVNYCKRSEYNASVFSCN